MKIMHRFPLVRVMMVLAKKETRWVQQLMQRNVMAIIPRNANSERFAAVLDSVSEGWSAFPLVGTASNRQRRRYFP